MSRVGYILAVRVPFLREDDVRRGRIFPSGLSLSLSLRSIPHSRITHRTTGQADRSIVCANTTRNFFRATMHVRDSVRCQGQLHFETWTRRNGYLTPSGEDGSGGGVVGLFRSSIFIFHHAGDGYTRAANPLSQPQRPVFA